jgi:hypothetical protein
MPDALVAIQCITFLGGYGTSTDPTPFAAWGAQLNVGALQPYYPTTVDNLLGYTQEFDNAAWTKSNSFVHFARGRRRWLVDTLMGDAGKWITR